MSEKKYLQFSAFDKHVAAAEKVQTNALNFMLRQNTHWQLQWAEENKKNDIARSTDIHRRPFTAQPGGDAVRMWDAARASCQLSIRGVITASPSRGTDGNSCSCVLPLNPSLSLPVWNTSST